MLSWQFMEGLKVLQIMENLPWKVRSVSRVVGFMENSIKCHSWYRTEMIKLDPGRARQNSLATAGTNSTKLCTSQVQAYFQHQYYLDLGLSFRYNKWTHATWLDYWHYDIYLKSWTFGISQTPYLLKELLSIKVQSCCINSFAYRTRLSISQYIL